MTEGTSLKQLASASGPGSPGLKPSAALAKVLEQPPLNREIGDMPVHETIETPRLPGPFGLAEGGPHETSRQLAQSVDHVSFEDSIYMFPYKLKVRAGRHVRGQSSYDPIMDARNWGKESLDAKGGLSPEALQTVIRFSENKPDFLTKFGKERLVPKAEQLFPTTEVLGGEHSIAAPADSFYSAVSFTSRNRLHQSVDASKGGVPDLLQAGTLGGSPDLHLKAPSDLTGRHSVQHSLLPQSLRAPVRRIEDSHYWTGRTANISEELQSLQVRSLIKRKQMVNQYIEDHLKDGSKAPRLKDLLHRGYWRYRKEHFVDPAADEQDGQGNVSISRAFGDAIAKALDEGRHTTDLEEKYKNTARFRRSTGARGPESRYDAVPTEPVAEATQ